MFEEVKNQSGICAAIEEPSMEIYDEDGDLNPNFSAKVFCEMGREEILEIDPGILADVILNSREVFTKATEFQYVAVNLLGACLKALVQGDKTLTKLFKNLTNNGQKNIDTEELQDLISGFVFAKSEELNALMMLDRML